MKKHLHFLRTLFLAALTLLCIFNAAAQTSDTLYIYHQGAVVFKRSVAQIDSMSYSPPAIALPVLASVVTAEPGSITETSATLGGTIPADGGGAITARGIVWSTTQNPTIALSTKTSEAGGSGTFTSTITGLAPSTTYYVRAYATNSAGTSYGEELSFTTKTPINKPAVTTGIANSITYNSAIIEGFLSSDGGAPIIERGFFWSYELGLLFTESRNITKLDPGTSEFNTFIKGLSPSCNYYFQAYAINSAGMTLGEAVKFSTLDIKTEVRDVLNPVTRKIWMDRSLGTSKVPSSTYDEESLGSLYQWGRSSDGHQKRSSESTTQLSATQTPGHGNFIAIEKRPYDWLSIQNSNLWQGVNGVNNPCPDGYRVPTAAELDEERKSWSVNSIEGAYNSPLKFAATGYRDFYLGTFTEQNVGYYWSSNTYGSNAACLYFGPDGSHIFSSERANANSIRCIKD